MEQGMEQAPLPEKETKARERARIILEVRSGKLTVTEGASLLGISRQRFYELEHRALSAMADALLDGEAGRPENPPEDPEKVVLKQKVKELEQEVTLLRQTSEVREALLPFKEWQSKPTDSQKKRQK